MKGVVVCPQPRAADVGAEILARGGTACFAVFAAAFQKLVTEPFLWGLGGWGTLQYFQAGGAAHGMIDFHNRAGSKVRPDMWEHNISGRTEVSKYVLFDDFRNELGYTSIMTPGTVAGLHEFHCRFATLPWAELIAPSAHLAREGFAVTPFLENYWTRHYAPGMPDGLTRIRFCGESRKVFLHPEGRPYRVGETFRNPDLAGILEEVGEGGSESFYQGRIGRIMTEDLESNGAFVTGEDLKGYRVRSGEPVTGSYRGFTVASNPPPGGGVTLIEMLHILEHFELGSLDHNSAPHLDLVARAMAASHLDREAHLGDPEFGPVPAERLVSKEHAEDWAAQLQSGHFPQTAREVPLSCTTHLSVYDEAGNAVSLTHTLGYGSGVVTPGLGFVYNNSMSLFDAVPGKPNSIAPGKARNSAMSPAMLIKDGRPVVIVGAPGSSVILSSVLQTILNIVDFGMSAVEAVTVPRIHCEGGALHAEARVEGAVCRELEALGHRVEQGTISFDRGMSRSHVVLVDERGWRGGADPRGGGGVAYSR